MTKIEKQVTELLQYIPDDKMAYLIGIMKDLAERCGEDKNIVQSASRNSMSGFQEVPGAALGIFKEYANPDLIPMEKEAWGEAVREKHADY